MKILRKSENQIVTGKYESELYVKDLKTLKDRTWINDEIINFFLKYLIITSYTFKILIERIQTREIITPNWFNIYKIII